MDGKVKVKFIKAMYPYNAGDEWYVHQMIVDQYPDHVEPMTEKVKTKEKAITEPVADKMIEKPIADKAIKDTKAKKK